MECSKCNSENPNKAKYCIECGALFEFHCPNCDEETSATGKFCMACGFKLKSSQKSSLRDLTFDEKLDKIQRYLPKGITEKILSQKGKIEGERKQVTVMFCDLEGFTPLVEQIGAEAAYNVMDQIYEFLIHKVHDYEGTINEMTGDGIMALFGSPIALEDAPQRAIRSAYAIHREMARFSNRLKVERKDVPPLKMRIGIHSGMVVVGTLGNNLRVEFKAVGDTVNLASRMEGMAEPGTIYVSADTFKLTEGFFRFEAIGDKHIKGKEAPVGVYRVIAPSTRKTRFDVNAELGLTPFIGRDRELELLIDSLGRAKEGSGQAFSIIGEAGIGKSRFLYEFRKAIANEDITFLEGKCFSYGKGIPYHPISDVLKGNFEIEENETDDGIRFKVKRSLEVLHADEAIILPYILELLAVKDPGINSAIMSPEGRKDRTIEAIKQIILKGAQIRPLVLAIEDLHWADKATEDTLKWLLEAVPGARVLIIFTYRPEFVHTWGGRSYHNQITLNRLSNRESLFIVSNLLGTDTIDSELQSFILSKTEGIPFFIEEFVKSLQGLEVIKRADDKLFFQEIPESISIPSTIQDVIMARVDSLPNSAKKVLQAGSAVEREFGHNLIKQIAGLPEKELLYNLAVLKDSELLYERGIYPQSTYIFKHALTREVVYDSILTQKKKKIHNEIGNALENIYYERVKEFYETLAFHYEQGEVWDKSFEYHVKAGVKARRTFNIQTAMNYFDHAKQIVTQHDLKVAWRIQFDLLFERGRALMDMGQGIYALKEFKNAEIIAKQEGPSDLITQVMFSEAAAAWLGHEINQMKTILEELETLVIHNANNLLGVVSQQVWCFFGLEDLNSVLSKEKELCDLMSQAPNSEFSPQAAHYIGLFHRWRGDIDKCIETLESALPVLKSSATPVSYLGAMFHYGLALGEQGKYQQAIDVLENGQKLGLESGEQYTTPKLTNSLGWVYHELCLFEKAMNYNNVALESINELLGPGTSTLFEIESQTRINLAENHLMMKKYKNALENLEVVYDNAQNPEYYLARWRWKPRCLLGFVETWLVLGDIDKAEIYLSELTDNLWLNEFPYKKYQVNTWRLRSQLLLKNNHFQDAEIEMSRALSQAKQLENPTLLWKTHQALGKLYLKLDKVKEAKSEFQKAIRIVNDIADGLTKSDLKMEYLQSETIQELSDEAKIN